jgi:hypothetical protein
MTPLLATVLLLGVVPLPDRAAADPPAPKDRTITLITGDKVVLKGGDQLSVVRAAGREKVGFESRRTASQWTVIPSDVRGAVETGKLD